MPETQIEPAIAIDRTNPARLFVTANSGGSGILASLSEDGGVTWTPRIMADGTDGLPAACCDPAASFDGFGNLFVSYLSTVHSGTARSVPRWCGDRCQASFFSGCLRAGSTQPGRTKWQV